MEPKEVLGRKCRDRINQFEGVCVGLQKWMFGCSSFMLKGSALSEDPFKTTRFVPSSLVEVVSDEVIGDLTTEFDFEQEEVAFGKYYRDIITGFEGICIGIAYICYNEIHYYLQPKCEKNKKGKKLPKLQPFDKGRLKIVENTKHIDLSECRSDHKGGVEFQEMIL